MPRRLTSFWIDPDLLDGLNRVKQRDGISLAEQYRRAIRAWLETKGVVKAERKRGATRKRS